jgi:riboflavin transporter FmnP
MMISLAVMAVTVVLEVMAIPGLFKRTKASWNLLFYASLVQVVGSVLAFNLIGAVIGAVISWYILFQMKDVYKN